MARLRTSLDSAHASFVIGGSFALAARGVPRFTRDIDVMVMVPDLAPIHRAFAARRFEWINEVTFRDDDSGLLIDVIPVEDAAQRHAFDTATVAELQDGVEVRVLSPEGCCIMLLREATLGDPARRPLRLRDIEALALVAPLDWKPIRDWSQRMGYAAAFGELRAIGKE
ncbi:MAG: hypothetical protein WDA16_11900 [Candidatus Thermoplasmatota archaeon]